jgi:hypothetical protein
MADQTTTVIIAVDGDLCVLFLPEHLQDADKELSLFLWNAEDGYFGFRHPTLPQAITMCVEEALEVDERLRNSGCMVRFRPHRPIAQPHRWTTYQHFRRLGFIVRDGLNYGVDFMLYREPPGVAHALYGVLILDDQGPSAKGRIVGDVDNCLDGNELEKGDEQADSKQKDSKQKDSEQEDSEHGKDGNIKLDGGMTWRTLHGICRCIFSTKKSLLVIVHDSKSDAIQTVHQVDRFVPSEQSKLKKSVNVKRPVGRRPSIEQLDDGCSSD